MNGLSKRGLKHFFFSRNSMADFLKNICECLSEVGFNEKKLKGSKPRFLKKYLWIAYQSVNFLKKIFFKNY